MEIPEGYDDLFSDDVTGFLVLGTASGADRVSVAPVWFLTDDRGLVFTSEDDSIKARDVRRQPEVAHGQGRAVADGGAERRHPGVRLRGGR